MLSADGLNKAAPPANLLLVEDEDMIRNMLAETLSNAGFNVIESASADDAWSYLEAGGPADLVFSDITMPGELSGLELIRRVKQQFPHMKTVLTSGNPGVANVGELGTFLPKPFQMESAARIALGVLGK